MEHRSTGVLLAETQKGREREGIESSQLLELRQNEARIAVELHRLSFDARDEFKVFRGAAAFELGRFAASDGVLDTGLGKGFQREMDERSWNGDDCFGRCDGYGGERIFRRS